MKRLVFWVLAAALCLGVGLVISCNGGDDDDTDDDAGDDEADDDDAADDDAPDHPCEGKYDVIIHGDYADDFSWVTTWTTKYVILDDQTTQGIVIPDAEGWPTYNAVGVRTAPGIGTSDGAFTTPADLDAACNADTVNIHVEYTVIDGLFQGNATYHCANQLGPFEIFGVVTCGEP